MNSPLQDKRILVMEVASEVGLAIARSMISASGKVAMGDICVAKLCLDRAYGLRA